MPLGKPAPRFVVRDPQTNQAIQDLYDRVASALTQAQNTPAATPVPVTPVVPVVASPNFISQSGSGGNVTPSYTIIPTLTAVPNNNPGHGAPYALDGVVIQFAPSPGDSGVLFRYTGAPTYAWAYQDGTLYRTQSQLAGLAALLGTQHANLLVFVTDYNHQIQWTGSAWKRAPGDLEHSDTFHIFGAAPTDIGWHACNGAAGVSFLKYDGTLGTRNLPNTASVSAFPLLGASYSANLNPPVDPPFTGAPFTPSGTVSSSFSGSGGGSGMSGTDFSAIDGGSVSSSFAGTPVTPAGAVSVAGAPVV